MYVCTYICVCIHTHTHMHMQCGLAENFANHSVLFHFCLTIPSSILLSLIFYIEICLAKCSSLSQTFYLSQNTRTQYSQVIYHSITRIDFIPVSNMYSPFPSETHQNHHNIYITATVIFHNVHDDRSFLFTSFLFFLSSHQNHLKGPYF